MRTASPKTIHDFGGFAPALYRIQYPAPGNPALAAETRVLLEMAGFEASFDDTRGLDHGVWVPMSCLRPEARTPVFQVSLPFEFSASDALRLGRARAHPTEEHFLPLLVAVGASGAEDGVKESWRVG